MRIVALLLLLLCSCAHYSHYTCQERCSKENLKCSSSIRGDSESVGAGVVNLAIFGFGSSSTTQTGASCVKAQTPEQIAEITEDATLAEKRDSYNKKVLLNHAGWWAFGATYTATILAGIAYTPDSYDVYTATGVTTKSPAHTYMVPVIGPLLEWESKSDRWKALSVMSTILQASGLGLAWYGSSPEEPGKPIIRLDPTPNGAQTSLQFKF